MPKLIRDKIPDLVQDAREQIAFHYASDEEYNKALREKLVEEVGEFLQNPSPEEMADILEVLDALCIMYDMDPAMIQDAKDKKFLERGGFDQKIILE